MTSKAFVRTTRPSFYYYALVLAVVLELLVKIS